jgi:3' terminal RNA ribose 2'-O-methyltransferase Hen1
MALILDIDPVEMVRGRRKSKGNTGLEQYINDRSYAASSFLSVAIAQVLGSALKGQCKERSELVDQKMPLTSKISVLPSRGGEKILHRLFEPLGYEVTADRYELDEKFTEWGESPYYTVELKKETTVQELLSHLYVLVPVLDNHKHYYIGKAEVEKLLNRGKGWLGQHPEKELIARRYLKYQRSLAREALARLAEEAVSVIGDEELSDSSAEEKIEEEIKLNEERLGSVLSVLKSCECSRIVDLGCGEGKLLRLILKEKRFAKILGMDVSIRSLEIASRRLRLDELAPVQRERIELMHGSLMYRDRRLEGYDVATVLEVVEHLDKPRLAAFERVVFEFIRPRTIILTTPNKEYNVVWENIGDRLRHGDHRFEWTRHEFEAWAKNVSETFGYDVRFLPVGKESKDVGSPTQMGIFTREN